LEPARLNEHLYDPSGSPDLDATRPEALSYPRWERRPKFQHRWWLHSLLFLLTIASTWLTGGWAYSLTILAILGCHEFGHYFMCRYYDVDASLPYFLPVPISLTGTLGAFIRIREPIHSKRMFFDIGIAGPIAGFLVAVPALFIGVFLSRVAPIEPGEGLWLGEPLLFKLASRLFWGPMPEGYTLILHPIGFAAWFGMLATALNLFPFGQLDGGHISYAVLGRRSTYVTIAMVGVAITLSYLSMSWMAWTVLMIVMLFAFGVRHPRTYDEEEPLDRTRLLLAAFAVLMFALCFTPAPIELLIPR
jgi:membrane-associated protease RseP (regulator of RpoE activity)